MAGDVYIFTGANDNYDVSLSFNYTQRNCLDLPGQAMSCYSPK
ncbi:hypothetical protein HanIR_Chr12g0607251 [Helianthus annuus]|nr:hypothetical protein HanIR_Chr12g0607251 [Helianthus annuus]